MRVALAQTSYSTSGEDRLQKAEELVLEAHTQGADLVVFPELYLGFSPASDGSIDLTPMNRDDHRLAALSTHGPDVVVGFVEDDDPRRYNSVAYLSQGTVAHVQRKVHLADVMEWESESSIIDRGHGYSAFDSPNGRVGMLVCFDAWKPIMPWLAAADGAQLLIVVAGSAAPSKNSNLYPINEWSEALRHAARTYGYWVLFVNCVGTGNMGQLYWGGSRIMDPKGNIHAQANFWESSLMVADLDLSLRDEEAMALHSSSAKELGAVLADLHRLAENTDPAAKRPSKVRVGL